MKKLFATLLATSTLACACFGFAACGESGSNKNGSAIGDDPYTITVGASQTPHAEILNAVKEDLAAYGYTLVVKVFDDYILPNTALDEGSLDANYFQHTPYLNTFNAEYGTDLVSAGKIHYEPFGVYGKNVTQSDFDTNKTGRTILIPNDGSNLARALYLLQDKGYITLKSAEFTEALTTADIQDSRGNDVRAVQAENVAQLLDESDSGTIAVINGNYALQAGKTSADALALEDASGDAAQLYANIIAVRKGDENHPKIKALLTALTSEKVRAFIDAEYSGSVEAIF